MVVKAENPARVKEVLKLLEIPPSVGAKAYLPIVFRLADCLLNTQPCRLQLEYLLLVDYQYYTL